MNARALLFVLGLTAPASSALAQTPAPAVPQAPQGGAQTAPAPPPLAGLIFGSEVGVVINAIKPDKTADFELIVQRLRQALQQSADPIRKQQLAGWKMLRASEPGPAGSVLYLFILDPVVKDADYTVSRILAEAFPNEVEELWPKLRDAYAGAQSRLTLQSVPVASPASGTSSTRPPAGDAAKKAPPQ